MNSKFQFVVSIVALAGAAYLFRFEPISDMHGRPYFQFDRWRQCYVALDNAYTYHSLVVEQGFTNLCQ